jgi:hypothetical protein
MASLDRLCPVCGAANALERIKCHACGADMMRTLPVPLGERLPAPWKEVGASLAVGAGVLALKVGLGLMRSLLERKVARPIALQRRTSVPIKVRRGTLQHGEAEEAPRARSQVRVWGRRMRGRWRSDGEGQLEVEEFYWDGGVRSER